MAVVERWEHKTESVRGFDMMTIGTQGVPAGAESADFLGMLRKKNEKASLLTDPYKTKV